MLDLPRVVDPEPVGELDLLEGVVDQALLVVGLPGPRQLVLVEDAELHGRTVAGGVRLVKRVAVSIPRLLARRLRHRRLTPEML